MPIPQTYLLTAPNDKDPFGRGISSNDMLRKLKKINQKIWAATTYPMHIEAPSIGIAGGATCLWFGPSGDTTASRKITGFTTGMIPEFTQLDMDGNIIALGWRRIFEKAIRKRAVRAIDVENAFNVTLDIEGTDDLCISCRKAGKIVPATSKNHQCDFHRQVLDNAEVGRQKAVEERYLEQRRA